MHNIESSIHPWFEKEERGKRKDLVHLIEFSILVLISIIIIITDMSQEMYKNDIINHWIFLSNSV